MPFFETRQRQEGIIASGSILISGCRQKFAGTDDRITSVGKLFSAPRVAGSCTLPIFVVHKKKAHNSSQNFSWRHL
ncbi:MAG: hypothetical protein EBR09_10960 [Proteobacteria bacterium]|nr:hypothetical protein [Pseudomonadota bacterium]